MKVSEAINDLKVGDTVWVKVEVGEIDTNDTYPLKICSTSSKNYWTWTSINDEISLTEPSEKVEIPEYVGKWIKFCKENEKRLSDALDTSAYFINVELNDITDVKEFKRTHDEFKRWLRKNRSENENLFAKAWLDGFTIEPKRWVVNIVMIDGVRYFSKFNGCNDLDYNYVGRKENAHIFTDQAKAEAVATLIDGEVEEVAD